VNFVSYSFAALFLVVFASRLLFGRRKVERPYVAVLLVSSLIFYGWHVPQYLAIILLSAAIDYVAALALGKRPDPHDPRRRWILAVSLASNLGLLGFFKYANFALNAFGNAAQVVGMQPAMPTIDILLPMGISFYTFQSMSYTIDVYRRRLVPLANFWTFLLYISFFPQLVAGPIVRAVEFLPQIPRVRRLRLCVVNEALFLLSGGYFLKMVCADNLAVFVNEHWNAGYAPGANSVALLWLAVMFGAQIFCWMPLRYRPNNFMRSWRMRLCCRPPRSHRRTSFRRCISGFWMRMPIRRLFRSICQPRSAALINRRLSRNPCWRAGRTLRSSIPSRLPTDLACVS
jgi:D-alanyl-lipoteichoic acid acyltransferase DltB (MBOAT superfamily)